MTMERPLGDGRHHRRRARAAVCGSDGYAVPKPMVPVAGVPLIESAIRNFVAAGITPLVIIVNEQRADCVAWVRERFPELDLRLHREDDRLVARELPPSAGRPASGRMLVSTVDAWCRAADFRRFVEAALAARARPQCSR